VAEIGGNAAGTMANMFLLLEAHGLVKHLGGRRVVDGVDLVCHARQTLGLLGPNGAGKTTTLRMLYGFLTADAGTIRFEGHDVSRDVGRFKRQLGVCTQDDTFDGDFTVRQNLEIVASYFRPRPSDVRRRADELLERFALATYAADKPEGLSGGFRRRLMIARALMHRPRLLFLDEPTTGLDPHARVAVWDLVNGLRAEGLGIVLTTHYMDEAERLSDALTVLAQGKVVAHGTPKSVMGDMLGEHVVVLAADTPAIAAWLSARGLGEPLAVLGAWHLPLSGEQLADFARAFPALRYEVRPPNLDDLFLKLALAPCAA
jgi:lipooligosaccharide transport system ATP-binding protein